MEVRKLTLMLTFALGVASLAVCESEGDVDVKVSIDAGGDANRDIDADADAEFIDVSPSGHFLQQRGGEQFFAVGETVWTIAYRSTRESVDEYFTTRSAQGFNAIQMLGAPFGKDTPTNAYDQLPFEDNDLTRPITALGTNNDYWDHVDYVIDAAIQAGFLVILEPLHLDSLDAWLPTPDELSTYGQWIAARYADYDHLVWDCGGEFYPRSQADEDLVHAYAKAIATGLNAGRSPNYETRLFTFHGPGPGYAPGESDKWSSSFWFHDSDWLGFNMTHAGSSDQQPYYDTVLSDFLRTPVKPTYEGESRREDPSQSVWYSRRSWYWVVFAGSAGFHYYHKEMWGNFNLAYLQAEGAEDVRHLKRLMDDFPMWDTRVPDQSLLTSPAGMYNSRRQAIRAGDGSYALVYSTDGGNFEVDVAQLSGPGTATWFDPRTGEETEAGTFLSSGTQVFDPPGPWGPNRDYVLILRVE